MIKIVPNIENFLIECVESITKTMQGLGELCSMVFKVNLGNCFVPCCEDTKVLQFVKMISVCFYDMHGCTFLAHLLHIFIFCKMLITYPCRIVSQTKNIGDLFTILCEAKSH